MPGRGLVATTVLLVLAISTLMAAASFRLEGPHAEVRTVIVPLGTSLAGISKQVEAAGVIRSALLFEAGLRITGLGRHLQAGEYAYPARASMWQIAEMMARGETVLHQIMLVEGATVAEVLATLDQNELLTGDVAHSPTEGSLFPDTYFFHRGEGRDAVVERAGTRMTELLATEWADRADGLPYQTPEEALVLASLVEAETGQDSERPRIAAVFVNRLKRGMRLQSDPTVLYGLEPKPTRKLSRADLKRRHPWNTYQIRGLPPTPIGNPGRASIHAALHPAITEELYFVADGSGGHAFAASLRQHNRNVARWRALQRQSEADSDRSR